MQQLVYYSNYFQKISEILFAFTNLFWTVKYNLA